MVSLAPLLPGHPATTSHLPACLSGVQGVKITDAESRRKAKEILAAEASMKVRCGAGLGLAVCRLAGAWEVLAGFYRSRPCAYSTSLPFLHLLHPPPHLHRNS